jgi:3-methyl-2-oxobutanoate hydroxymethyltransferase
MSEKSESRVAQVANRVGQMVRPISALTAYDYPMGRLVDEAGIEVILVGDSLGMVVGGLADTTGVTLEQMVYHTQIVRRAVKGAVLVADLPINTYRDAVEAVESAQRLMDAGADAVKLEGGGQMEKIAAMLERDIPTVGHLGMLPQKIREEGGYKKKGKNEKEAGELLAAARALSEAGVAMIVLESVAEEIATTITQVIKVPTLGIGSGRNCSGQIRVLHDVIGAYPWFVPPFAKTYTNVADQVREALQQYRRELK